MKKIIIFSLSLIFVSCKSISSSDRITAKITNKIIREGDTIVICLRNNSDKNYFLPIDFKYKGQPPMFISYDESLNFFPNFTIKNNSENDTRYICSICDKENTLIHKTDYFKNTSDVTLIESKSEKIIKIVFNKKNVFYDDSYCEYLLEEDSYSFQILYSIDKKIVEEFISDNLIKELTEKKFQCYNGLILTNNIQLINTK